MLVVSCMCVCMYVCNGEAVCVGVFGGGGDCLTVGGCQHACMACAMADVRF